MEAIASRLEVNATRLEAIRLLCFLCCNSWSFLRLPFVEPQWLGVQFFRNPVQRELLARLNRSRLFHDLDSGELEMF